MKSAGLADLQKLNPFQPVHRTGRIKLETDRNQAYMLCINGSQMLT